MSRDDLDRAADMVTRGFGLILDRRVTILTRDGADHTGAYRRLLLAGDPFRIIGVVIGPADADDVQRFIAVPWENVAEIWTDELPATDLPTDSDAS